MGRAKIQPRRTGDFSKCPALGQGEKMKKLNFCFLFLVAVTLLTALTACVQSVSTPWPTALATAAPATRTPAPTATATQVPTATATLAPTATATAVAVEESTCPLLDKGVQVDFEKVPDKDGFYILSSSMKELSPYQGCQFLVEGRQILVEEHHIWAFSNTSWTLKIREGSVWVYPAEWNMGDFSTKKAPIAAEFVTAKRNNQSANGYDWVIYVHIGTQTYEFPAGQDTPIVTLPDNADFVQPEPLEIHGVWDAKTASFNVSIGAEGATTVALLDGKLVYWAEAQDNVFFKSAEAWLMPSKWSQDQIEDWAKAQFPKKELGPYKPAD